MLDLKELYWAAGFLEGEGCFYGSTKYPVQVSCYQVDTEPLVRLQKLFGGQVKAKKLQPNRQPYHVWLVKGYKGVAVMFTLYSLMSERRQNKIKDVMKIWMAKRTRTVTI